MRATVSAKVVAERVATTQTCARGARTGGCRRARGCARRRPPSRSSRRPRYSADVWEDLIREWLTDPAHSAAHYTTAEIMEGALNLEPSHMRQPEQTRVGMIMSRLGWTKRKKTVTRTNGSSVRKWVYERPDPS